jgi:DNA-binding GntR family transcriptional regulator
MSDEQGLGVEASSAAATQVRVLGPHRGGQRGASSPEGQLRPVQLKDMAYQRLRAEITEGTLQPGDALREAELSRRLGVSKTPIREALVRLQRDRLVELVPYKGAVVSGYTRSDLAHIYQLREILEGACARDAARSASPEDLSALAGIVRDTERALADGDDPAVVALFYAFDEIIYGQTSNPYIADLIEGLGTHLYRIGQLTLTIPGRLEASAEQHERIYDAIVRRDAEAAEARMREHVTSVMIDQLAVLPEEGIGRTASQREDKSEEEQG